MTETFLNGRVTLHAGDCLDVLATLPENSIDSCVTDPPYHLTSIVKRFGNATADDVYKNAELRKTFNQGASPHARAARGFMGKQWDGGDIAFRPETWAAVYRVLKPGAHLIAFGGTRTYHRMACAIEDAGFEIRDCIQWLYGSGFPKSHSVAVAIDKSNGIGPRSKAFNMKGNGGREEELAANGREFLPPYEPATDAARQWQGWGTALKPSHEDLIVAQKPYEICGLCDSLVHKIMEALCQLPLLANAAGRNSASSLSVYGSREGSVFAQWNAALKCNTPDDLFALMDMWPSGLEIPLSLSTALSWLAILVEASTAASTFTTETESSLITDLKTLNCLLSKNTAGCIIEAATNRLGIGQNVSIAEDIFSAVKIRLRITNTLSAPENVSALAAAACPAEGANYSPNCEPIVLARKPLSEKTVAANVLKWGTGAINVDGCRVEGIKPQVTQGINGNATSFNVAKEKRISGPPTEGRWPANVIHDGSEEVVAGFPETTSGGGDRSGVQNGEFLNGLGDTGSPRIFDASEGSAARFFYTAKADSDDRLGSRHPTVKPLDLIQYLVRLITPKSGVCLDPFAGTGTIGEAAWREGMRAVLIECEPEYQADIRRRMALCLAGPAERARESIKAHTKDKAIDHGPLFGGVA